MAGMMDGLFTKGKEKASNIREGIVGDAPRRSRFIFWLAILIQIIDVVFLQYNRTNLFYASVAMYLGLAIFAAFVFHDRGLFENLSQIFIFVLLSAFYVVVPFFLYFVPRISIFGGLYLLDWISFFLAIFPLWPIYIGLKEDIPFVHKYVNLWIIFLLFLFVFGFAFQLNPGTIAGIGGRPELIQVGPVFSYISEQTANAAKNFWKAIVTGREQLMNATGLPGFFPGYAENDVEPTGVYITNVRSIERINFAGKPATLWVDFKGKSFTEEIIANSYCYIDKGEPGITDPAEFRIFGFTKSYFECTLDHLSRGSYRAAAGLSFNFETWGYVTYSFVDQELARSYEMQGKDIRSELKIDSIPRAVYTNGPVMLGMSAMIDQPVQVDRIKNSRDTILGVTLADQKSWTEGKLGKVSEFILMVPQDFELRKCDRGGDDPKKLITESREGYDFYTFKIEYEQDPRVSFQTITCWLHIKNPDEFLGGAQKVDRTFIAKTKYEYQLEKKISLTVRE